VRGRADREIFNPALTGSEEFSIDWAMTRLQKKEKQRRDRRYFIANG
jgi:hypothetical protein